jgi:PadR family transcriptional regulator AphA
MISLVEMSNLSPTARVILGLLRLGDRTGYDLKQTIDRSTRFFWSASYGQIDPELRRLEEAGLVRSEDDPRGGVPRRVFELTDDGERVLEEWLTADGPDAYEMRDEGLLRLFFGDLAGRDDLIALARRRREWFSEVAARFRAIEDEVGSLDDSASGAVLDYGVDLMEWNARWFAALERRLRNGDRPRPRPRGSPQPESQDPAP